MFLVLRRLPLGSDECCGERSASPSRRMRSASLARDESSEECLASPFGHDWSPYPTPPAAPRKDQYIPESEGSDDKYDRQRRPPRPAKLFRNGQLIFHRTYTGPEPIGYVDTGLYEGGNHDWYEAYTDVDLAYTDVELDLVLQQHHIERWSHCAQFRRGVLRTACAAHRLSTPRAQAADCSAEAGSTARESPSRAKRESPSRAKRGSPSRVKRESPSRAKRESPSSAKLESPSLAKREFPSRAKYEAV